MLDSILIKTRSTNCATRKLAAMVNKRMRNQAKNVIPVWEKAEMTYSDPFSKQNRCGALVEGTGLLPHFVLQSVDQRLEIGSTKTIVPEGKSRETNHNIRMLKNKQKTKKEKGQN